MINKRQLRQLQNTTPLALIPSPPLYPTGKTRCSNGHGRSQSGGFHSCSRWLGLIEHCAPQGNSGEIWFVFFLEIFPPHLPLSHPIPHSLSHPIPLPLPFSLPFPLRVRFCTFLSVSSFLSGDQNCVLVGAYVTVTLFC